jgi:hypothetical protein
LRNKEVKTAMGKLLNRHNLCKEKWKLNSIVLLKIVVLK